MPDLIPLDEFSARVGLSVRTVRFYTSRSVLPAPVRKGRSGFYTAAHVARAELVQELRSHGFTLAAIERYVAAIPEDATPVEIALARTMLAPWQADLPVALDHDELEARAGRTLTPEDIATLNALGVLRRRADSYLVAHSQLSSGLRLLELGFPREVAVAAAAVYAEHGERMADELHDVVRNKLAPLYADSERAAHLREILERLKPLSVGGLVTAYESAIARTLRHTSGAEQDYPPGRTSSVGPV